MVDAMKIVCIIPARYNSSRFPGKPLADINGKPMIWWVHTQAKKVHELDEVYVATDDDRIAKVVEGFGGKSIMTSDKHATGTDRLTEAAEQIFADWYVNIQGDEPFIEPDSIRAVLPVSVCSEEAQVVTLMSRITNPTDLFNPNVVKAITSERGRGVYLTRSAAPFPRNASDAVYYKHYGVYSFSHSALEFFRNAPRGRLERIEDAELLRFIESGYYVKFVEIKSASVAVDTENDLKELLSVQT